MACMDTTHAWEVGIQPKPASLYYLVHLAIILVKDLPNVANTIVQQIECKIINVHSICIQCKLQFTPLI